MHKKFSFQKPFEPEPEPASDMRSLTDRARQLRSEAVAGYIAAGARRVWRLAQIIVTPFQRHQQKRVLEFQLSKYAKEEPKRVGLERRIRPPLPATAPAGHGPELWQQVDRLMHRLAQTIALWARRRSLRNQLADMPENILKDIGVNPSDLDGAVEQFLNTAGNDNRPHAA